MPVGNLVYRADEYSFDFEPAPLGALTSVLINDLNLELDGDGRLVSVWGMCPYPTWKRTSLTLPSAENGEVFFVSDLPLVRGVSVPVNKIGTWPVYVDLASGWVRVASGGAAAAAVKPLPGVIVETTWEDDIASLWLMPASLPELIS